MLESFFAFGDLPQTVDKGTYAPLLVLVSYVIAVLGAYTGMSAAALIPSASAPFKKQLLMLMSAVAYGGGFWATHFVGMLAHETTIDVSYNLWGAALSLVISVGIVYLVLKITHSSEAPSKTRIAAGSVLLGLGIATLHYTGMSAAEVNALLRFDPVLFFLSVAVAITASSAALAILFSGGRPENKNPLPWRILAAMVLGAGVCGAHYIATAAAVFLPAASAPSVAASSPHFFALVLLAAATLLLFILTFALSNRIFLIIGCSAIFALPLVIITHQALSALNVEIENLEREQFGIVYHRELSLLLRQLQDTRDLSRAVTREPAFSERLTSEKKRMHDLVTKIHAMDLSPIKSKDKTILWTNLKNDILSTFADNDAMADDPFEARTRVILSLISYMNDIADTTNMSSNPETGKDHLLDYTIHAYPAMLETASFLRGLALDLLPPREAPSVAPLTEAQKLEVKNNLYLVKIRNRELSNILERVKVKGEAHFNLLDHTNRVLCPLLEKFSNDIEKTINARDAVSALNLFALASTLMDSYPPVYDRPLSSFSEFIEQEKASRKLTGQLMFYSSVVAFIGFISLFFFLNRSLVKLEKAREEALQAQRELAVRLVEKERLERQMQDYTDRLELSRFDVMAANTKLKEEETKTRTIVNNVLEGIVTLDDRGHIQTVNKAAEALFGYDANELTGQAVSVLLPPEQKGTSEARLKEYIETSAPGVIGVEKEITGQKKDGTHFPIVVSISEVVRGNARLFIALIRDITVQKEKEREILKTKERAEAANRTKSDFLANMSHELRTPLNSIIGMTHLLMGTKLSLEQEELASTVLSSSSNLMEIVNDILDLSKIEAGEVVLECIDFDPRQVLHSVIRSLAHVAKEKNVPIARLYEDQTLPYVKGDPLRLTRILTNLLSNAIKYTDKGHIEVRAVAKKIEENNVVFHCEVTDTGIGIPEEKLQSVFDKFVQADSSTTRKYGGTGLGLAITRELVVMMGGKIGVSSAVGEGSTFWFSIPFETTGALQKEEKESAGKAAQGSTPAAEAKILVAEDHPMNQLLIKKLLVKFDIGSVEVVPNGNEVLRLFRERGPWTAILMNCHMPEKNGYDATRDIRDIEKKTQTHIPIIAMTANAMVGDKEKCLDAGMDEYVSKPIEIGQLKDVLSQWIAFPSTEETPGDAMPDPLLPIPVDLTMLRTLTGGDIDVEQELMKTFVDQSDRNLETMRENASADGENKPWIEAAHMLKGGSGSIGAEELRQLCNQAQLYTGDSSGRQRLFSKIEKEYARVKEHLAKEGLLA